MKISPPRTATKADAAAILEIFNHYIAHSTANFILEAQTLDERLKWFERAEHHPVVAIDADEQLVGWGALLEHNSRAGYRHTADVSVYVHPDFHRRGIGRGILQELIVRARALDYHTLVALCCSESVSSIALHETLGFVRIGHYREVGRKFDRWLDVVALQLML